MLSSCVCLLVCPSVCLSQAGIVAKRLEESSWFLAWRLPSNYPTLCCKEIWASPEIRVLPSGAMSQLQKISSRQVDRVVNKTRRRRRSSLLTTPIGQSTHRGSLPRVGRLQPSNSITAICCAFVVQVAPTVVREISTDPARRAVPLR